MCLDYPMHWVYREAFPVADNQNPEYFGIFIVMCPLGINSGTETGVFYTTLQFIVKNLQPLLSYLRIIPRHKI